MKKAQEPDLPAKTPFQRFDTLVHTVLRAPHQPKPKPAPRKPSR